jgi:hypothetical protein
MLKNLIIAFTAVPKLTTMLLLGLDVDWTDKAEQ